MSTEPRRCTCRCHMALLRDSAVNHHCFGGCCGKEDVVSDPPPLMPPPRPVRLPASIQLPVFAAGVNFPAGETLAATLKANSVKSLPHERMVTMDRAALVAAEVDAFNLKLRLEGLVRDVDAHQKRLARVLAGPEPTTATSSVSFIVPLKDCDVCGHADHPMNRCARMVASTDLTSGMAACGCVPR